MCYWQVSGMTVCAAMTSPSHLFSPCLNSNCKFIIQYVVENICSAKMHDAAAHGFLGAFLTKEDDCIPKTSRSLECRSSFSSPTTQSKTSAALPLLVSTTSASRSPQPPSRVSTTTEALNGTRLTWPKVWCWAQWLCCGGTVLQERIKSKYLFLNKLYVRLKPHTYFKYAVHKGVIHPCYVVRYNYKNSVRSACIYLMLLCILSHL